MQKSGEGEDRVERELEYLVLKAIADSAEPIGSWALRDGLARAGVSVSEATAGRILREMDRRGFTERRGFRGRVLTPRGEERLQALARERQASHHQHAFLQALRAHNREQLIEILEARRAIESEVARLAALRAPPDLLEEMARVVDRHQAQVAARLTGWQEDAAFHRLLARAAGNRLLLAASELVREEGQLSPVLEYIRGRVGSVMVTDHRTILEKVVARDPEGAQQAMARHIDNVMRDVLRFWEDETAQAQPGG